MNFFPVSTLSRKNIFSKFIKLIIKYKESKISF